MPPISRGFHGRRRSDVDPSRLPPGQYLDAGLPGALGRPDAAHADSTSGASRSTARSTRRASGRWDELLALPPETFTVDIHCVTKWSKLDTTWTGVSLDTLLEGVETEAEYVTAWCDGDYTTNLPLEDLTDGKAWVVHTYDGEPLEPEHGGPARLLVPHLYFWKSAKWVRGLTLTARRRARLLGGGRLPQLRRPVAGAALLERLSARAAGRLAHGDGARGRRRDARARARSCSTSPGWPGHRAGQHVDVRLTAEDGYQAQRSLLDRLGARGSTRCELTVERVDDGEVSPYLVEELRAGRPVRGPRPDRRALHAGRADEGGPLLLVAGGSGLVPLMAMLRHRAARGSDAEARLLVSARSAGGRCSTARELERARAGATGCTSPTPTRARAPPGWTGFARRVDARHARRGRPGAGGGAALLRLRADAVRRARRRAARRRRPRRRRDPRRALRPHGRMR